MERPEHNRPRRTRMLRAPALLAAIALLAAPDAARATLTIGPANLRLNLDGARPSGTFTLTNTDDQAVRYRAKAVYFEFTETGGMQMLAPNEHSLTPWIRFNPAEFDLPPKSSRAVRYSLPIPKDLKDGEYWGAIEFEPLESVDSKLSEQGGRTMNLKVFVSTLVPIFGTKGKSRLGVEATEASISKEKGSPVLKVRLRNSGTGRLDVEGRFELRNGSEEIVREGALPPAATLLSGGARVLSTSLPGDLTPGNYKLRLRLEARQLDKTVEAEFAVIF